MDNLENQYATDTETKPLIKSHKSEGRNVILGITGASGAIYGVRILRALIINNFNVDLIITEYGQYTLFRECGMDLNQGNVQNYFPEMILNKSAVTFHSNLDLKSEIFLHSYNAYGVIVAPCSMSYISKIACGGCNNLIVKCADHALAYSRPLIAVPRETPVNKIHLHNMIKILDAGGKLIPAMPGYENNPKDFNDLGDYIAGLALDLLMGGRSNTGK
ncbi:MAG: UbiX family flavin prenyltransferase [Ignavibacteriae bacterium]|nr:UbiX family flavin prenyltransferase [Ignavibacteriota bacterium]